MDHLTPDQPENRNQTKLNDPSAEEGKNSDNQVFNEQDPKSHPYWNDPDFQKLLSAYQKADWTYCLKSIEHFEELYPNDSYLSSLRKEIEIRSNLHIKRKKQRGKEKRSELGKKWGWIFIVLVVVVLTSWAYFQYQNRLIKEQQAIEAVKFSQALDTKFQSAENLMQAGKPKDAIILYQEIQQANPTFADIDQKIEQAEAAIAIENLYQEGVLAQTAGNLDLALSTFIEVDSISPKYKDTEYRIDKIKLQQQIDMLDEEMNDAYAAQDWIAVATAYESIQELDPFFSLTEAEKEILFISLHNLIIQTVDKGNLSLEEIESAVHYYQTAMALFPQDKKFTDERENLHKTTADLLINKYYLYAVNLLEESNYSAQSLTEAIRVLTQVESISGGSDTIAEEIKKTKLFLDSYNQFLSKKYDQAIIGFEELRKIDVNYAGGKVNYLLIESYLAYGDILYKYADFSGAKDQYLEAEKYAWTDKDHVIRLFLVELKVAKVLNRLWATNDAASYYHYAFGLIDFKQHLLETNNQEMISLIDNANAAYADNKMRNAVLFFEQVVERQDELFGYETEKVTHGDSLPDIAFEFGCTIDILKSANKIGESLIIQLDQDLLIPKY